jgi:hypothetical protein
VNCSLLAHAGMHRLLVAIMTHASAFSRCFCILQVFPHTTNPAVATGDGMAMAHRAKAALANMEFVQFHPTSLYNPSKAGGRSFLISEAVRGEGGMLFNHAGDRFMERCDPSRGAQMASYQVFPVSDLTDEFADYHAVMQLCTDMMIVWSWRRAILLRGPSMTSCRCTGTHTCCWTSATARRRRSWHISLTLRRSAARLASTLLRIRFRWFRRSTTCVAAYALVCTVRHLPCTLASVQNGAKRCKCCGWSPSCDCFVANAYITFLGTVIICLLCFPPANGSSLVLIGSDWPFFR